MLILPRSNPLYENIPVHKINLPEALKKMGDGGFTGYLGFGSTSSEGYFIYIRGALISILMLEGTQQKSGFEAISGLFNHATSEEGGIINVYRLTVDLAVCTNALLHGTVLVKPELVSGVDLKALLARMKTQALNGTVLFSTTDRGAAIFYKDGMPIGFYHDAASEIETSPTEAQRIAAIPGATIEIRSSPPADELLHHNLLETLNIDRLWQASVNRRVTAVPKAAPSVSEPPASSAPEPSAPLMPSGPAPTPVDLQEQPENHSEHDALLSEIVDDLHEIAKAYLGRQGADLVDSLLDLAGGKIALRDSQKVTDFLSAMPVKASAIDPEAKIEEMVDLMRSELSARLPA